VVASPAIFVRRRTVAGQNDFPAYGGYLPFLFHIGFVFAVGVVCLAAATFGVPLVLLVLVLCVGGIADAAIGTTARLRTRRRQL
jgi:hypothetical protein